MKLLLSHFAADGPVIVGTDDAIERRRGAKIEAKGVYRDLVRSSESHLVKTGGLRAEPHAVGFDPLGGAGLGNPVLHRTAPSERYSEAHRQRHKALTD